MLIWAMSRSQKLCGLRMKVWDDSGHMTKAAAISELYQKEQFAECSPPV